MEENFSSRASEFSCVDSSAKVYFSLGSNLGYRRNTILKAIRMMEEAFSAMEGRECVPLCVSSIIETEPWGFESENRFLNCAVCFALSISPTDILHAVKGIESSLGRENHEPRYDGEGHRIYSSRPIDIDILLYGDMQIDTPELKIPHPKMWERDFVLTPLREIMPDIPSEIKSEDSR